VAARTHCLEAFEPFQPIALTALTDADAGQLRVVAELVAVL
jgi:hypothetical protein